MPPSHVLIIGGGIAGPALAIALARRSIRSTIFELRPTRGDSGGSITLAPNALRVADKTLGVFGALQARGFTYHRVGFYADDGYKFGDACLSEEGPGGYPVLRIMRTEIHTTLLERCEALSEFVTIVYGARMTHIDDDVKGVTVHFEDGTRVTGDVLIGADGIHSKVREHVLGSAAPTPIYTGSVTVAGFMPRDRVVLPTSEFTIPAAVFTPVGLVMVVPVNPAGTMVTFGISEALAEPKSRAGWTEYERSGEASRAAKRNYAGEDTQPVRSLIDGTDDAAVRLWAPYSIPDLPTWHRGRVCLIGDAAHALPPNGQGSAQALEDAGVLARLLASEQAVAQGHDRLFAHFERVRRARVETVKKFSKAAGAAKGRSGPWVWWAKKWALWAYMSWWSGGVFRDTRLMGYDVDEEDILVK